jgi:hypothetical protein
VNRDFGKLLNKWVTAARSTYKQTGELSPVQYTAWKDMLSILGLNSTFGVLVNPEPNAASTFNVSVGQSIIHKIPDAVKKIIDDRGMAPAFLKGPRDLIEIDLSRPYISGILPKEFITAIVVTTGIWNNSAYTDEEVTAILLHEIGHSMDVYLTLGESIFINYFMTEGADILLGNRKNILKFEILDLQWLRKNGRPEEIDALLAEPTPENTKRIILTNIITHIRDTMFTGNASSWKRSEQLADQFAVRLGYGRALASTVYKTQKEIPTKVMALVNGFQIAFTVFKVPAYVFSILTGKSKHEIDSYDTPDQRLKRIRLDLVAQLKYIRDSSLKAQIARDIAVIDELLVDIQKNQLFYNKLDAIIYPELRRSNSHLKNEETLQELFHNQLFVDAFNLKTQGTKK